MTKFSFFSTTGAFLGRGEATWGGSPELDARGIEEARQQAGAPADARAVRVFSDLPYATPDYLYEGTGQDDRPYRFLADLLACALLSADTRTDPDSYLERHEDRPVPVVGSPAEIPARIGMDRVLITPNLRAAERWGVATIYEICALVGCDLPSEERAARCAAQARHLYRDYLEAARTTGKTPMGPSLR